MLEAPSHPALLAQAEKEHAYRPNGVDDEGTLIDGSTSVSAASEQATGELPLPVVDDMSTKRGGYSFGCDDFDSFTVRRPFVLKGLCEQINRFKAARATRFVFVSLFIHFARVDVNGQGVGTRRLA